MPFYYTHLIILPMLSSVITGALALHTRKLRNVPVAAKLFWVMAGSSGWCFFHALNTAATTVELKVLFLKCGYCSAAVMVVNLPLMFFALMGRVNLAQNRALLLLFSIVPAVSMTSSLIPGLQPFFRSGFHLVARGNLLLLGYTEGFWYRINIGYLYVLELFILLASLRFISRGNRIQHNSLIIALIGMFLPLLTNTFPYSPAKEFSMSTSVLFITGLCYWWAALRHHLLDLVPIAREALFEELPEPVLVVDSLGRLSAINKAADQVQLNRMSLGLPLEELFPSGHALFGLCGTTANRIFHDIGTERWWQVSRKELRKGAELYGSLVVLHDITELQQLQMEREENEKQLTASLAAEHSARSEQERFIAMVAHEYRTPLAIIQANHDILGLAPLEQGQRDRSLAIMSQGIRRLKEIFDGYLQKTDFDLTLTPNPEPLDFRDLVRRIVPDAEELWGPRFMLVDHDRRPATISADGKLLKTMILNILDNAAKYTPEADAVDLAVTADVDKVSLVCENNPGVGQIDLTQVFQKYYRGKNKQGTSGTGVGLYLVSKIVESHGGTAGAEISNQGRFRITITLPTGGDKQR